MAVLGFYDPLSLVAIAVILGSLVYAYWRKALLTFVITVACCIIYGLEVASSNAIWIDLSLYHGVAAFPLFSPTFRLVSLPTFSPPWTFVTYQFVHGGFAHLLFNILAFVLIAPVFEERIGSVRFGVIYFAGGIVGAAGFLLLNASPGVVLVGASESISAIFGGYGRLYPRDRVQLFFPMPGLPTIRVIDLVIGFLVLETALSFFGGFVPYASNVAWEAHVIAMVFGLAVAPLVMRIPLGRRRPLRKMSFEPMRALATTPELRSIVEEAERADLPEIRDAWVEKFVTAMRCPRCGGPVKRRLGRLTSPCGWRGRIS